MTIRPMTADDFTDLCQSRVEIIEHDDDDVPAGLSPPGTGTFIEPIEPVIDLILYGYEIDGYAV